LEFETENLNFWNYIKSNVWMVVLFVISFIFISFAINKFFEGLILIGLFLITIFISYIYQKNYKFLTKFLIIIGFSLFLSIIKLVIEILYNYYYGFYEIPLFFIFSFIILIICMFFYLINYLYHKNHKIISLIIQIFNVFILTFLLLYFKNIIIIFLLIFSLFFAIFYYINHKKEFRFIILTSILSITISFTISFIAYLVLTSIFLIIMKNIEIFFYSLILAIISFVFITSYCYIQNSIFKKIKFDLIDNTKILKIAIRFTIIIFIVLLLIFLMISNNITNNLTNNIDNKKSIIITNDKIIFENENLNNEEFIIELNNEIELINKKINEFEIKSFSIWDKLFNLKKIHNTIIKEDLYLTKLIVQKELIYDNLKIIESEYNWIENNFNNNQSFYHGHDNINEHILKIEDNINILFNNYTKEIYDKNLTKNFNLFKPDFLFVLHYIFIYYYQEQTFVTKICRPFDTSSNINFSKGCFLYELIIKITSKIVFLEVIYNNIFNEYYNLYNKYIEVQNIIINSYNNLNNENNKISKLLKLKILEYQLSKELSYEDISYNQEDLLNLTKLTKNPYLCSLNWYGGADYEIRDECIYNYSFYNKEVCTYIDDEDMKKDCLKS
jgi:hypothetical protein